MTSALATLCTVRGLRPDHVDRLLDVALDARDHTAAGALARSLDLAQLTRVADAGDGRMLATVISRLDTDGIASDVIEWMAELAAAETRKQVVAALAGHRLPPDAALTLVERGNVQAWWKLVGYVHRLPVAAAAARKLLDADDAALSNTREGRRNLVRAAAHPTVFADALRRTSDAADRSERRVATTWTTLRHDIIVRAAQALDDTTPVDHIRAVASACTDAGLPIGTIARAMDVLAAVAPTDPAVTAWHRQVRDAIAAGSTDQIIHSPDDVAATIALLPVPTLTDPDTGDRAAAALWGITETADDRADVLALPAPGAKTGRAIGDWWTGLRADTPAAAAELGQALAALHTHPDAMAGLCTILKRRHDVPADLLAALDTITDATVAGSVRRQMLNAGLDLTDPETTVTTDAVNLHSITVTVDGDLSRPSAAHVAALLDRVGPDGLPAVLQLLDRPGITTLGQAVDAHQVLTGT